MSDEFDRDLASAIQEVEEARDETLSIVKALKDDELTKGRRGSWDVRGVIDHIVGADRSFAGGIARQTGAEMPAGEQIELSSTAEAVRQLEGGRRLLLSTCDGVDEETFYKMESFHGQDASVLGILGTASAHDREHSAQIQELLSR